MQKEIQIKVDTKPYEDFALYQNDTFTFYPGINSLVGCNGSGKSTLLMFIKSYLRDNDIAYLEWNDRNSGGLHLMDKYLNMDGNMEGLINMAVSSEGERIIQGLGDIFAKMGPKVRENSGDKLVVMFDAIDSGMSVDEIIEIRNIFFDTILPDAEQHNTELYIIIAANNYEWCADSRIHNVDINSGKPLEVSSYEDFKKIILQSKDIKNRRYQGNPK